MIGIRLRIRKIVEQFTWVVFGAWIVASYVRFYYPGLITPLELFAKSGVLIWIPLLLCGPDKTLPQNSPPKPTSGGMYVVIFVTIFGAVALLSGYRSSIDLVLPALVVVAGLGAAAALHRFIRLHGAEIGEARFGPDGHQLGPWRPPAAPK